MGKEFSYLFLVNEQGGTTTNVVNAAGTPLRSRASAAHSSENRGDRVVDQVDRALCDRE